MGFSICVLTEQVRASRCRPPRRYCPCVLQQPKGPAQGSLFVKTAYGMCWEHAHTHTHMYMFISIYKGLTLTLRAAYRIMEADLQVNYIVIYRSGYVYLRICLNIYIYMHIHTYVYVYLHLYMYSLISFQLVKPGCLPNHGGGSAGKLYSYI